MSIASTDVRSSSQQVEAGCQFFHEGSQRGRPVFPPTVDLADLDFDVTGNDDDCGHRRRNASMISCAGRTRPAFAAVQALEIAS